MRKQEEAAAKLNKVGDDSPSKHTRKRGGNWLFLFSLSLCCNRSLSLYLCNSQSFVLTNPFFFKKPNTWSLSVLFIMSRRYFQTSNLTLRSWVVLCFVLTCSSIAMPFYPSLNLHDLTGQSRFGLWLLCFILRTHCFEVAQTWRYLKCALSFLRFLNVSPHIVQSERYLVVGVAPLWTLSTPITSGVMIGVASIPSSVFSLSQNANTMWRFCWIQIP